MGDLCTDGVRNSDILIMYHSSVGGGGAIQLSVNV